MIPRPLQILEPTWLSTAPSAIPLIVLPNATMTWFSVPRWPSLNCFGCSAACPKSPHLELPSFSIKSADVSLNSSRGPRDYWPCVGSRIRCLDRSRSRCRALRATSLRLMPSEAASASAFARRRAFARNVMTASNPSCPLMRKSSCSRLNVPRCSTNIKDFWREIYRRYRDLAGEANAKSERCVLTCSDCVPRTRGATKFN